MDGVKFCQRGEDGHASGGDGHKKGKDSKGNSLMPLQSAAENGEFSYQYLLKTCTKMDLVGKLIGMDKKAHIMLHINQRRMFISSIAY